MNAEPNLPRKPLRLWPGVVAAALLLLFKFAVVPIVGFGSPPVPLLGGLIGGGVILLWWLLFSRSPWAERLGAIALMAVALFATSRVVHESLGPKAGGGFLFFVLALPAVTVALVAGAVAARHFTGTRRRLSMAATIVHGRPGTPMPPWRAMLDEADARWIAEQLARGFPELPQREVSARTTR